MIQSSDHEFKRPGQVSPKDARLIQISVFFASASTLALELLQIRVLSFLYWSVFVYLIITIALMGTGLAGVLVCLVSRRMQLTGRTAAFLLALFAMSVVFCIRLVSLIPPLTDALPVTYKLMIAMSIVTIPFFLSGTAIGTLLMLHSRSVQKIYGYDLLGGAAGVIAFTFLLRPLGAEGLILVVMLSAVASFAVCAWVYKWKLKRIIILSAVPILGMYSDRNFLGQIPDSDKLLGRGLRQGESGHEIKHTEWTPIARIDVSDFRIDGAAVEKIITQDGTAWTHWVSPEFLKTLEREPQDSRFISDTSLSYAMGKPGKVLIIGVGGGRDVFSALAWGAESVTAVEINPAIHDMFRGNYHELLPAATAARIHLELGEGRHFADATHETFDTIVINVVDTYSATSIGNVFSENFLYTVEAMERYLSLLRPNGKLTISRSTSPLTQDARLLSIFLEASRRLGISQPAKHIFATMIPKTVKLMSPPVRVAMIFKKEPFEAEEMSRLFARIRSAAVRIHPVYVPAVFPGDAQAEIEKEFFPLGGRRTAAEREGIANLVRNDADFIKKFPIDISPVFDDTPYFYNFEKTFGGDKAKRLLFSPIDTHQFRYFALALTLFAIICMIAPLLFLARDGLRTRQSGAWCLAFAGLGAGFMFAELGFIQSLALYIEGPINALSTVVGGLLFAAGIGSLSASKSLNPPMQILKRSLWRCAAAIVLWILFMKLAIHFTVSLPFYARALICLVAVFPVGLQLGIPFSSAMRCVSERSPAFVPWAWGISGLSSVVTTLVIFLLAPVIGITNVVIIAAGLYVGVFLVIARLRNV